MDNYRVNNNRRGSLNTRVLVYTLIGAVILGVGNTVYDISQKKSEANCKSYGWLMDQPIEVQRDSIKNDLERKFISSGRDPSKVSETAKNWNADLIIVDLKRNCNPE